MNKLLKKLVVSLILCLPVQALADSALIQLGPNGQPIVLPIAPPTPPIVVSTPPVQPSTSTVTSAIGVGSLPATKLPGYIYYTLPGGINLTTPWSAGILAEGWDFIGKEEITQGYVPLANWWKLTAVAGGGVNSKGVGSPLGGGIIDLAQVPISPSMDFHVAATGGYNFNAHHAMAVLSGSVQFLK